MIKFLAVMVLLSTAADARGLYPDGPRSNWFKSLKQPVSGASCCDVSDCKQTQAVQAPDGHWRAILQDYNSTRWIDVPPEKVVRRPTSIDGEAYICSTMGAPAGVDYFGSGEVVHSSGYPATIYCFIPPVPGY